MAGRKRITWSPAALRRLALIATGGGALLYAVLIFLPGQRALRTTWLEVTALQQQISQRQRLSEPLARLREELKTTRAFLSQWQGLAPAAKSAAPVLGTIVYEAREAGAELVGFTPEPRVERSVLSQLPVRVECRGSFQSLHEFFRRLEAQPYPLWLDELELQRHDSNAGMLECSVKMTVFSDRGDFSG
jgi:Tfp pilus assembly protein PilO